MVGLQPAQAVLHRLHHVQPGEAPLVRAGAHGPEHLGGQDDPFPRPRSPLPQGAPDPLLGGARPVLPRGVTPVAVGRVQEGQPPVQRGVDDALALRLVCAGAEHPAAEAELGDADAGRAQETVGHRGGVYTQD